MLRRLLEKTIFEILDSGKSLLLLGPRQTGKSTLVESQIPLDLTYSLLKPSLRRQFEQRPEDLLDEIAAFKWVNSDLVHLPRVYIDEIQLVPELMEVVQFAVDKKQAQFILTGSSARKLLKRQEGVNLLPGRLINVHLDALCLLEMPQPLPPLENLLIDGSLPEIFLTENLSQKERLLQSYIDLYLEKEIRAEALVRNLGDFSRFLKLAAIEAGNMINYSKIANDIGLERQTIQGYFQLLEDCLIIDRIEPITDNSFNRKRLSKAPKYLFFDMGVRRLAAEEGRKYPEKYYGLLFEQFVGLECLKLIRLTQPLAKLSYWKDHTGPEVDYVIELDRAYLPIEVKYTQNPTAADAKDLKKFMAEYPCFQAGLVVCQIERPKLLAEKIIAIPWQKLPEYLFNPKLTP